MRKSHVRTTIKYYLLVIAVLVLLFVSGDFGLVDVQKTAIVMAVGVDREDDTFIVTSQIAIPQSSKQGKAAQTVQLVSRGKTVAAAFEEINAKTGWYPKLVFCNLILLGETTTQTNVFDALDFFLLNEYLSDNCLVACCDGTAKDMLNVAALVDPSGSVAMQKVLSNHAARVGTVFPTTLREFTIGYFGDLQSGSLPIIKTQPQQEKIGGAGGGGVSPSSQSEQSGQNGQNEQGGQSEQSSPTDKPVFSAGETALFARGIRVGKLTSDETFALGAALRDLKLAAFSVETDNATCTLTVKNNERKTKLQVGADGRATLKLKIILTAGLLDYSQSLPLEESADGGDVPSGVFSAGEKLLAAHVQTAFDKCRIAGCDLFGVVDRMQKYHPKTYAKTKDKALETSLLELTVHFRNIR